MYNYRIEKSNDKHILVNNKLRKEINPNESVAINFMEAESEFIFKSNYENQFYKMKQVFKQVLEYMIKVLNKEYILKPQPINIKLKYAKEIEQLTKIKKI